MRLTYTNPVNNRICYLTCKRLTDKRHWQFCKRAILSLLTCWSCSVRESLCVEWTSSPNDCTRQIRCPKAKTWNSVTRPQFTVLKHVFIVFQTRFSENLKANFPSSQASTSILPLSVFFGLRGLDEKNLRLSSEFSSCLSRHVIEMNWHYKGLEESRTGTKQMMKNTYLPLREWSNWRSNQNSWIVQACEERGSGSSSKVGM